MKIILFTFLLLNLSSCFKTDLDSALIPFTINEDDSNDGEFVITLNINTTPTPTEYFGRNAENLGSVQDNTKAISSEYPLCIKKVSHDYITGPYSGSDTVVLVINSQIINSSEMILNSSDYKYTNIKLFPNDKMFIKTQTPMTGQVIYKIYFGSCDY